MADEIHNSRTASAQYDQVLSISDDVRHVVAVSNDIMLVAVNAMLIAKQAGPEACGFGVVSSQLRIFSRRLHDAMEDLRRQIFTLILNLTSVQKQSRMLGHMLATAATCPASAQLQAVITAKEDQLRATTLTIENDWARLAGELKKARRLCESGEAFGRNAKVEAAYARAKGAALHQVADQMEAKVGEIVAMLKSLVRHAGYRS